MKNGSTDSRAFLFTVFHLEFDASIYQKYLQNLNKQMVASILYRLYSRRLSLDNQASEIMLVGFSRFELRELFLEVLSKEIGINDLKCF